MEIQSLFLHLPSFMALFHNLPSKPSFITFLLLCGSSFNTPTITLFRWIFAQDKAEQPWRVFLLSVLSFTFTLFYRSYLFTFCLIALRSVSAFFHLFIPSFWFYFPCSFLSQFGLSSCNTFLICFPFGGLCYTHTITHSCCFNRTGQGWAPWLFTATMNSDAKNGRICRMTVPFTAWTWTGYNPASFVDIFLRRYRPSFHDSFLPFFP